MDYDLTRTRRVTDPVGYMIDLIKQDGLENVANRFYGKYPAHVIDNEDPQSRSRVRLLIPTIGHTEVGDVGKDYWARPDHPGMSVGKTGQMHGWFLPPEVGDEVWVTFRNGDPRFPVYSGGTMRKEWEGTDLTAAGGSKTKGFRTKSGHYLRFSDDGEDLHIMLAKGDGDGGPSGSFITIDKDGGVLLMSDNGSHVWLNKEGKVTIINANTEGTEMLSWLTLDDDKVLLGNKSGSFFSMDGGNVTIDAKADLNFIAGGKVWLNSGTVALGLGPWEPVVKGDTFSKGWCVGHQHVAPPFGGLTAPGPYPVPFIFNDLSTQVKVS